jgi:hypothetical protein
MSHLPISLRLLLVDHCGQQPVRWPSVDDGCTSETTRYLNAN